MKVGRTCLLCSRSFYVRLVELKNPRGGGKFCSRSCGVTFNNQFKKGRPGISRYGEANPNWKGGVSKDHYRYKLKFVKANPEKVYAQHLVHKAIKSGALVRKPCEHCGATERIHGHHADYSKPLDVTWLCQPCHIQEHARLKRMRSAA